MKEYLVQPDDSSLSVFDGWKSIATGFLGLEDSHAECWQMIW